MSPRYKKPRKCTCPFKDYEGRAFKPVGIPMSDLEKLTIFHDELEAMRLCDMENLTQEEAGKRMGISRGTVQRLLTSARKKLAEAIVGSKAILFEKD